MNVAAIAAMIEADPTIPNDISGFVARMNAATISQVVQAPVIVQQAVTQMVSVAQQNGGECTIADVQAAITQLGAKPYVDTAKTIFDAVVSALASGDKPTISAAFANAESAIAATKTALGIS